MPYKISSLNVNSIVRNSRRNQFLEFHSNINSDIYLLQETKLNTNSTFHFPGYNIFRCDFKTGWPGVAILARNDIPVRNVRFSRDGVHAVFAEFKINHEWLLVSSVYFPHGMTGMDISLFFSGNKNTLYGGDFNARHTTFGDVANNTYSITPHNIAGSRTEIYFGSFDTRCRFKTVPFLSQE